MLPYLHEMGFDWLTRALPLEKFNIFQLSAHATQAKERNGATISVRQRMTLTDPLTDQRIETQ